MKDTGTKERFIELRAQGNSLAAAARELSISKSTASTWNRELRQDVDELRRETMQGLFRQYHATREARVRRLGDTIERIDGALSNVSFDGVDPVRLLDIKLKYMRELKDEYTADAGQSLDDTADPRDVLRAFGALLDRVRAGDITPEQAGREGALLKTMLDTFTVVKSFDRSKQLEEMFPDLL